MSFEKRDLEAKYILKIEEESMKSITLTPIVGLPLVQHDDDLSSLINTALTEQHYALEDGDIVVIAQKLVSKAEGRVVALSSITPTEQALQLAKQTGRDARLCQVFLNESTEILRVKGRVIVTKHRLGFECSSAGVDRSNVAPHSDGLVSLLPANPDRSATLIREGLTALSGKTTGVIINDSFGRHDRDGAIGIAIGIAGISHLEVRSQHDLYGNEMNARIALVDEIAAAASILMGQGDEKVPAVVVRGVHYTHDERASITKLLNL